MQVSEYDSRNVRILDVRPWVDFADHLAGFDLISISAGPVGELYALAVTAPANYREERPSGGSRPRIRTDLPHDFRILRFDGGDVKQFVIPGQHQNFSFIQPLPDDELLLVVSRSRYFADDVYDLNASALTTDGRLHRQFLLGDGINDVQTTADGRIWTSYSDEGIFGSFGWKQPVGKSGLILWDPFGIPLYQYSPPERLGADAHMTACYALNVVSNTEMWCYYYDASPTDTFRLVRRQGERTDAMSNCRITGARGVAIWQEYVLLCGRYWQRETFNLYARSDNGRMHHRLRFYLMDEHGAVVQAHRVVTRGSTAFLRSDTRCYRLDIRDLMHLL
jgi:hypothetical protein